MSHSMSALKSFRYIGRPQTEMLKFSTLSFTLDNAFVKFFKSFHVTLESDHTTLSKFFISVNLGQKKGKKEGTIGSQNS